MASEFSQFCLHKTLQPLQTNALLTYILCRALAAKGLVVSPIAFQFSLSGENAVTCKSRSTGYGTLRYVQNNLVPNLVDFLQRWI